MASKKSLQQSGTTIFPSRCSALDQLPWHEGHVSSPYVSWVLLSLATRAGFGYALLYPFGANSVFILFRFVRGQALITALFLWIWMSFWSLRELGSWWPAYPCAVNSGHSDSLELAVCSSGCHHTQAKLPVRSQFVHIVAALCNTPAKTQTLMRFKFGLGYDWKPREFSAGHVCQYRPCKLQLSKACVLDAEEVLSHSESCAVVSVR